MPLPRGLGRWILLLAGAYVGVTALAWNRTLIPDETWHLIQAAEPLAVQLNSIRTDLTHPPLMYLVSRSWLAIFGHTDTAAKMLVLLLGGATIAAFCCLAARCVDRWKLTSVLFAVAFLQIGGVATLVRGYSLGLLLTVGALVAWESWRRHAALPSLGIWACSMVLLVHTHYVGTLVLAAFVIANQLYGPRRRLFSVVAAACGVAILPWLVTVLPVYASRGLHANLGWVDDQPWKVAAKLPFHFLTYFPSGWNPLGNNDWPRIPWLHTTMIVGALLMHGTILWLGRRALDPRRPDPGNRALEIRKGLVLTATPVLLLLAFSAVVYPTLDARFVIFVLPTYWLVIVGLAERAGRAGTLLIYAVLLPWLGASIAVPLLRAVTGPALHDSVARIANAWRPGDLIVADTVIGRQVHWEWTRAFQRNDPMVIVARPGLLDAPSLPLRPLARTDLDGVRRVWLFHTEHNEQGVRGIRDSLERSNFVAISDSIAFVDRYDRP